MYMRYYDGYPSDTFGADGEAIVPSAVHGDSLEMLCTEGRKSLPKIRRNVKINRFKRQKAKR